MRHSKPRYIQYDMERDMENLTRLISISRTVSSWQVLGDPVNLFLKFTSNLIPLLLGISCQLASSYSTDLRSKCLFKLESTGTSLTTNLSSYFVRTICRCDSRVQVWELGRHLSRDRGLRLGRNVGVGPFHLTGQLRQHRNVKGIYGKPPSFCQ